DSVKQFKSYAEKHPGGKSSPPAEDVASAHAEKMFGLQLQELTAELTEALGFQPGRGVLISAVEPGSPADEAGIERGLVIYRVGKHDVNSVRDVENLLARARSGISVDFTVGVVRAGGAGQRVETVTLAAR
ncbi:MAG TPA: PDZ domain-containing protein, partial [Chthoniobacterales bacterium]|nr:PDZ domain-containing protein [Chthoniobacterales bacterium]